MTTNQPESLESRLNRLETIFADMGDVVIAQSEAINALTANINNLAEQAAIDRQSWQTEIQRIWEYLLQQGGNGRHNG